MRVCCGISIVLQNVSRNWTKFLTGNPYKTVYEPVRSKCPSCRVVFSGRFKGSKTNDLRDYSAAGWLECGELCPVRFSSLFIGKLFGVFICEAFEVFSVLFFIFCRPQGKVTFSEACIWSGRWGSVLGVGRVSLVLGTFQGNRSSLVSGPFWGGR